MIESFGVEGRLKKVRISLYICLDQKEQVYNEANSKKETLEKTKY